MDASGLGTCPRKLLEEMADVHSIDIILPTQAGPELHLRVAVHPEERLDRPLDWHVCLCRTAAQINFKELRNTPSRRRLANVPNTPKRTTAEHGLTPANIMPINGLRIFSF